MIKKLQKVVYEIPCSCDKRYIGETGRSIKDKLKEHIVDIHHNRIKNSAIAEHCHNTNHHICIKNTKVLATIPHYYKRKIREVLEIEKHVNNLNQDDGLKLKEAWKPVLHAMKINPTFRIQYH